MIAIVVAVVAWIAALGFFLAAVWFLPDPSRMFAIASIVAGLVFGVAAWAADQ